MRIDDYGKDIILKRINSSYLCKDCEYISDPTITDPVNKNVGVNNSNLFFSVIAVIN